MSETKKLTGDRKFVMEGVEVWRNPKNKFVCFQLHYSANPVKRDPKYRENIKSAMPVKQYMQEYELQWDSFVGLPVFQDYNKKSHGSETRLEAHLGLPLLIGFDFGLTPSAVIAQFREGRLFVLKEFVEFNMGAERFVEKIVPQIRVLYPSWGNLKEDFLCYIDPAGFAKAQTDERTCAEVIGKHFKPRAGAIDWESRKKAIEFFLIRHDRDGAIFQLDLAGCPMVARGFAGGYRYPERAEDVEPNKLRPLKDEHSHAQDALQYLCTGIVGSKKGLKKSIPDPSYSRGRR